MKKLKLSRETMRVLRDAELPTIVAGDNTAGCTVVNETCSPQTSTCDDGSCVSFCVCITPQR